MAYNENENETENTDKNPKSQSGPFDFATVDDSNDVGQDKHPQLDSVMRPFDKFNGFGAMLVPIGLVFIWLILMVLIGAVSGLTVKGLGHWPVVMGDVSKIGILNPISQWVAAFVKNHGVLGLGVQLFMLFAKLITMMVCTLFTAFIHAGFVHWLTNAFLFLLIAGVLIYNGFSGWQVCRNWLNLSALGIGLIWLIFEMIALIGNDFLNHHSLFYKFGISNVPIVGASVGIYGLLAFTITFMIRNFRVSVINQIILILLFGIALALIYQQLQNWSGLVATSKLQAALMITTIMHLTGFVLGGLYGIRTLMRR